MQKQGGKSKKGQQKAANMRTNKYGRQKIRTAKHKRVALEAHLKNNPKDLQNKEAIKVALKRYQT